MQDNIMNNNNYNHNYNISLSYTESPTLPSQPGSTKKLKPYLLTDLDNVVCIW